MEFASFFFVVLCKPAPLVYFLTIGAKNLISDALTPGEGIANYKAALSAATVLEELPTNSFPSISKTGRFRKV